jgi:O-antigen/teichoic acid export membrane protein/acetyltransferase-like isoleucine patch superfamily enzyme
MLVNSTAFLFEALLKSAGRAGAAGLILIAQSATTFAVGAALIAGGTGPAGAAIAYLIGSIAHLGGTTLLARPLLRASGQTRDEVESPDGPRAPWRERLAILREAAPLALSGAFIAIYFRIDAVMLHALQGAHAVGLYGGIYRLFEAGAPICGAYHSVLFPALVRAANGSPGSLGTLCRQSLRMLLLGSIAYCGFVAVESERIVGLILGSDYMAAAPGLAILIWATPLALMSTTLLWTLAAIGRQALGTWAVGTTALANVGLNLFLIPRMSFMGASLATLASELLCFLLLCLALRRGLTTLGVMEMIWRPAIAGLALVATLGAMDSILPRGVGGLAMAALVGAVVYFIPLVGLQALGPEDARLLLGVLPEGARGWLARRIPRHSLPELVRRKGVRNLLRIAWHISRRTAFSTAYTWWLRLNGVRIGKGCIFFGPIEIFGDPRRLTIGDRCIFQRGGCFWTHDYDIGHGAIEIGAEVTFSRHVTLNSYALIQIGDLSGLGDGCYIQDNDHGTEPGLPFLKQPVRSQPIRIGRDVWLGARCIVLKGVTIGDHAVIGAGSVVVKPIPGEVVAVGIPCRPVKLRGVKPLPHAA